MVRRLAAGAKRIRTIGPSRAGLRFSRPCSLLAVGQAPAIAAKWHIDDSDGALLFGLGVHGQYLFVNAEKLVVAEGCCPTGCSLDAARITATFRALSAVRRP
jgi:hypothetical protein